MRVGFIPASFPFSQNLGSGSSPPLSENVQSGPCESALNFSCEELNEAKFFDNILTSKFNRNYFEQRDLLF